MGFKFELNLTQHESETTILALQSTNDAVLCYVAALMKAQLDYQKKQDSASGGTGPYMSGASQIYG